MRKIFNTIVMISLFAFFSTPMLFAQISRDHVSDAFNEMEGELTLYFFNALNGEPIEKAQVTIDGVGEYTTDDAGRVFFPIPEEDGKYRVRFQHTGFISPTLKIEIMAGSLFFNRFSISPRMAPGTVRIVLDWGKKPPDLDAHLVKENTYHISYRDMSSYQDGVAKLDRDDRNGFGPETITIKRIDPAGTYTFYVHNYSDRHGPMSKSLSKSRARVLVYGGDNQLLHTFQVPQESSGIYWKVFDIRDGLIQPVNRITKSN